MLRPVSSLRRPQHNRPQILLMQSSPAHDCRRRNRKQPRKRMEHLRALLLRRPNLSHARTLPLQRRHPIVAPLLQRDKTRQTQLAQSPSPRPKTRPSHRPRRTNIHLPLPNQRTHPPQRRRKALLRHRQRRLPRRPRNPNRPRRLRQRHLDRRLLRRRFERFPHRSPENRRRGLRFPQTVRLHRHDEQHAIQPPRRADNPVQSHRLLPRPRRLPPPAGRLRKSDDGDRSPAVRRSRLYHRRRLRFAGYGRRVNDS